MTFKTKSKVVGLVAAIALTSGVCRAGERIELQPKSMAVATLLGLDPVPGDALIYAGRTGQGIGCLGVGIGGLVLGVSGFVTAAGADDGPEARFQNGLTMMLAGAGLYAGSLLWDLIGGTWAASDYNDKIAKRTSLLQNVKPMLAASPNGGFGGVEVRF